MFYNNANSYYTPSCLKTIKCNTHHPTDYFFLAITMQIDVNL